MIKRLCIAAIAAAGLLVGSAPADAVVGGSAAPDGAYPFMAAVINDGGFLCGGTVIASRWVLTAAHCLGPGSYSVSVGSNNRTRGRVIAVDGQFRHPSFNEAERTYDVGLLHLAAASNVARVTLAGGGDDDLEADGVTGTLVGWGDVLPTGGLFSQAALRHTPVNVLGDQTCHGETASTYAATTVCGDGTLKGSCNGDSGGPLVALKNGRYVEFGVVSHGLALLCGYGNLVFADKYAEVNNAQIRNWIAATAGV